MQFSHPSCISVNTLVLWPSVPETQTLLRHDFYWFSYLWLAKLSLKYKTMGLLDLAVLLLLFLESHLFLSTTASLMTPQWPGQPNGNKLIQTHLHLNETDQGGGSVSHTLLTCFPSPFANEPYLTPTLIVLHLLPPAILSTLSFFPPHPFQH